MGDMIFWVVWATALFGTGMLIGSGVCSNVWWRWAIEQGVARYNPNTGVREITLPSKVVDRATRAANVEIRDQAKAIVRDMIE